MSGHVIHIFGPSGAGTSTLGRAICEKTGFFFMDTDDYFWAPTDLPYTVKRPTSERLSLMEQGIIAHKNVVISGSLVDWGDPLIPRFTLAVRVEADTALRLQRLRDREHAHFGSRINPGGDMYQAHRDFLAWAASYDTGRPDMRSKAKHDLWQTLLPCPLLCLDGAAPLDSNLAAVMTALGE